MTGLMQVLLLIAGMGAFQFAYAYPERPIRVVVPFPPGGGADVTMRRERLLADGNEAVGNTLGEFAAVVMADIAKYANIVKAPNIKLD